MRVAKVLNDAFSLNNPQKYYVRHFSLSSSINSEVVHLRKKFSKREGVQPTEIEIDVANQYEKLAETVTPLVNTPYDEQLKIKNNWSRYVLNQFVSSRKKELCTIEKTISSPVLEGYRNKSEFSIRNGADGNPKTVGTFIGSAGLGRSICVPPTHLINTPQIHKDICKSYEDYIRSSDLPACHDLHDGGFWRQILIRSNRKGECMLSIAVHPGDKTEAQIDEQMAAVKDYFAARRNELQLTSLYFQVCKHSRCTHDSAPYRLLDGEPHITETVGGKKFQISPDSFFQVNVEAAEKLYEAIFRVADVKSYSLLLDLCCGTGVISILGSSEVRSCVGVDCVMQAVQDANENARINKIQNCAFLKGRIEEVLRRVLKHLDASADIVAVLNPGRVGMPADVIHELRKCVQIRKLIYVSCMADSPSMTKNFNWLRNTKFSESPPFNVTRLVPVDLFPHTYHCEAILVFER